MVETVLLVLLVFTFGWCCGSVHRLETTFSAVSSAAGQQMKSPWVGQQAARELVHLDQDALPDVGPLVLSQTVYCRLLHHSVRAR